VPDTGAALDKHARPVVRFGVASNTRMRDTGPDQSIWFRRRSCVRPLWSIGSRRPVRRSQGSNASRSVGARRLESPQRITRLRT
jgi:hypothetical protein